MVPSCLLMNYGIPHADNIVSPAVKFGHMCPADDAMAGCFMTRFIKDSGIPLEAQYMYHQALNLSIQGKKEEALNDFQRAVVIAPVLRGTERNGKLP